MSNTQFYLLLAAPAIIAIIQGALLIKYIDAKIDGVGSKIDGKIDGVTARIDGIQKQIDQIFARLTGIETALRGLMKSRDGTTRRLRLEARGKMSGLTPAPPATQTQTVTKTLSRGQG